MRHKLFAIIALLAIVGGASFADEREKPSDIEKGLMLFNALTKTVEASKNISPRQERKIGQGVAQQVFMRYGAISKDFELVKYVSLVGWTVAQYASDKRRYRFAVIENREINAFATPGGYVFITTGLLAKLENEAQLAGVLAHEIAHVDREHMLKTIQRNRGLKGLAELSAVAMDKRPDEFNQVIAQSTNILFTRGLDKSLEYEADKEGLALASRAGYNSKGLYSFLRKLKANEGKNRSIFFSTHPSASSRMKKLERKLTRGGKTLKERFMARAR